MAALNELIQKVENPELRAQIQAAADKLTEQKQFGLVFEEHLPECTPLYDLPIKKGAKVALKAGEISDYYTVLKIKDGKALCIKGKDKTVEFDVDELVCVAEFGEPIYPSLQALDSVCNAPDSDLWHTLIEADNYHALQLLEYLYAGKVDCIYIDPPYNKPDTKDWKYNNNYVDGSDAYRHSKWLSMMNKRLKIAKNLLDPSDSVLIVTIDEMEYLHLGCLLEDIFPDAAIQMVSITINPSGAVRKNLFARSDEYAFFVLLGGAKVIQQKGDGNQTEARWWYLRRLEYSSRRSAGRPLQFYPIYIDNKTERIVKIGDPLKPDQSRDSVPSIKGATTVFPIRDDGLEMVWGVTGDTLQRLIDEKVVQVPKNTDSPYLPYTIKYLSENYKEKVETNRWAITGYREDGSKIVVETGGKVTRATTVWKEKQYESKQNGTILLKDIIGTAKFSFPKSLYAVKDAINYFVKEKPNALIIDFFAGSGTTLHAVNLLNAEDGGHRRCILVTNNEVSESEATSLKDAGYQPGDEEWNKLGIARYVTWPRTVCSITGRDIDGKPLDGDYGVEEEDYCIDVDDIVVSKKTGKPISKKIYVKQKVQKLPNLALLKKADGFQANAVFFKLGFLDKTMVSLGRQFKEILPVLWMKAGAHGPCPAVEEGTPSMLILPENRMAILNDENCFEDFSKQLAKHPEIDVVYIVTDYEAGFVAMTAELPGRTTYQLYRDYLENFRINAGRNAR